MSYFEPSLDKNQLIFYDIEVYQNLFCITFTKYTGETRQYLLWDEFDNHSFDFQEEIANTRQTIRKVLKQKNTFVGYNNIHYDDPMLFYFLHHTITNHFLKDVKYYSDALIRKEEKIDKRNCFWRRIDCSQNWTTSTRMARNLSLKSLACNLNYPVISDLPYHESSVFKNRSDVDKLLEYNARDNEMCKLVFDAIFSDIELRFNLGQRYKIFNAVNVDKVNLGMKVLIKTYCELTHLDEKQIIVPDYLYTTETLHVKDLIQIPESFALEKQQLYEPMMFFENLHVKFTDKNKNYTFNLNGVNYTIGLGGLHSNDSPMHKQFNNDEKIYAPDVQSYYPNLIINLKLFPRHLGVDLLATYADFYKQRIEAKQKGNKQVAEDLKLLLNGFSGSLKNQYAKVFDPKANVTMVVNGQLYLLLLAQMFHNENIKVISANTDGVEVILKKDQLDTYHNVCKLWESRLNLILEHTVYKEMYRLNVNNYLAVTDTGKLKQKGDFVTNPVLEVSHDNLIIPFALQKYLVDNIPVEKTIEENLNNKYLFCEAKKLNKASEVYWGNQRVQRLNRYYASRNGLYLYVKRKDSMHHLNKKAPVQLFNDSSSTNPIDTRYYLFKIRSIIDVLEKPLRQLSLF